MGQPRDRSGYLPSLDGWRAIAILGVMWTHDVRRIVFGHRTEFYQNRGGWGLYLFFAISGVLITWRILEDEKVKGRFDIRSFYIRRFFRIQPVQWIYLAVIAALMLGGVFVVGWKYWAGALFLFENFLWHDQHVDLVVARSYTVGHFWTLAVEEHFYLLISIFFFTIRRRRTLLLGGLLGALLLAQHIGHAAGLYSPDVSSRRTYWVMQYLLFASFAALLLRHDRVLAFARRWWRPWVAYLATIFTIFSHHLLFTGPRLITPHVLLDEDATMLLFSFTGWITASMLHPRSWTTRLLETVPLRFIGRISYSLYLWHVIFFGGGNAGWCHWRWITWTNGEPQRYILAFAVATASYYCFERPMIRFGHRLAPSATPGHRDLEVKAARTAGVPA